MSGMAVARRLLPALGRPFLSLRAPHDPATRAHPEPSPATEPPTTGGATHRAAGAPAG